MCKKHTDYRNMGEIIKILDIKENFTLRVPYGGHLCSMQSVTYIDLLKSPGGQLCKGIRALTEMCFLLGSSVTGGPS